MERRAKGNEEKVKLGVVWKKATLDEENWKKIPMLDSMILKDETIKKEKLEHYYYYHKIINISNWKKTVLYRYQSSSCRRSISVYGWDREIPETIAFSFGCRLAWPTETAHRCSAGRWAVPANRGFHTDTALAWLCCRRRPYNRPRNRPSRTNRNPRRSPRGFLAGRLHSCSSSLWFLQQKMNYSYLISIKTKNKNKICQYFLW